VTDVERELAQARADIARLSNLAALESLPIEYPQGLRCDGYLLSEEDFNRLGYENVVLMLTFYSWPFLDERIRETCRKIKRDRQ